MLLLFKIILFKNAQLFDEGGNLHEIVDVMYQINLTTNFDRFRLFG